MPGLLSWSIDEPGRSQVMQVNPGTDWTQRAELSHRRAVDGYEYLLTTTGPPDQRSQT